MNWLLATEFCVGVMVGITGATLIYALTWKFWERYVD